MRVTRYGCGHLHHGIGGSRQNRTRTKSLPLAERTLIDYLRLRLSNKAAIAINDQYNVELTKLVLVQQKTVIYKNKSVCMLERKISKCMYF